MLSLPESVSIYSVNKGAEVRASLVDLSRKAAAQKIDGTWWEIGVSKRLRAKESDNHWQWRKLVGEIRDDHAWDAIAVQSVSGNIEGAMTFRVDALSQLEKGLGVVYVDRLAVAPRNRPWLVDPPKYQGIGTVLLFAAVRESYLLGLEGRVWLTSLPSERTREFYRKKGFQEIFSDEDGMIDFELPKEKAEQWLRLKGYL
jgi:GNAT superfamily N-acetyltransferase